MMRIIWKLSISTLIISLFFPFVVWAAAGISISLSTSTVDRLGEFNINTSLTALEPNIVYYVKAVGGESMQEVQTKATNSDWLSWNSGWENFPQVTASAEGTGQIQLAARFKEAATAGQKEVKVRIQKQGADGFDESTGQQITVNIPATPQPTPSPTLSPTPSPTPKPTPSPTITPRPTPRKTATPKPTIKASEDTADVAGLRTENNTGLKLDPSPTPKTEELDSSSATPLLAFAFIVGGIVMVGFAIISSVKKFSQKAS